MLWFLWKFTWLFKTYWVHWVCLIVLCSKSKKLNEFLIQMYNTTVNKQQQYHLQVSTLYLAIIRPCMVQHILYGIIQRAIPKIYFSTLWLLDCSNIKFCVPCISYTRHVQFYALDFNSFYILQSTNTVCMSFVKVEISAPGFNTFLNFNCAWFPLFSL